MYTFKFKEKFEIVVFLCKNTKHLFNSLIIYSTQFSFLAINYNLGIIKWTDILMFYNIEPFKSVPTTCSNLQDMLYYMLKLTQDEKCLCEVSNTGECPINQFTFTGLIFHHLNYCVISFMIKHSGLHYKIYVYGTVIFVLILMFSIDSLRSHKMNYKYTFKFILVQLLYKYNKLLSIIKLWNHKIINKWLELRYYFKKLINKLYSQSLENRFFLNIYLLRLPTFVFIYILFFFLLAHYNYFLTLKFPLNLTF